MFTAVELLPPQSIWDPRPVRPLEEEVWQAWLARGRAQDRRRSAAFTQGIKWASIAGLLAALGHWPHLGAYDLAVRFVVAAGATAMVFQAIRSRDYLVAVVFGALVLLYNPVAPVFGFSGQWQTALVVVSAVPFIASLASRKTRTEINV